MLDQRSEVTVLTDRWDVKRYDDTAYKVPPFREARDKLHEVTPKAFEECRDLFQLFVKNAPKLVAEEMVRSDFKPNWQVNSAIMEHPRYEELHWLTRNDAVGSALAVRDILPELIPLYKRSEELQRQLEEQQQRQEELLQALQDLAQANETGDQDAAQEAQDRADSLQHLLDAIGPKLDSRLEAFGSAAQAAAGRGMERAVDNAQDAQTLARGFDLTPAELAAEPPEDRLELAKLLNNERIKQAAKYLGALANLASSVIRMRPGLPEQIKGIRLSDALEFVLPDELAQLDDEAMQWQFLADFADQAVLSYDVEGREHKSEGGVAVGLDVSGSMNGAPSSWGAAVTMALAIIAHKEKRPFVCVLFNTRVKKRIDLSKDNFIQALQEIASVGAAGGTCFTEPLDMLLSGLEEHAIDGTTQSDIVFITDDQCGVPDYWLEQYHRRMEAIGGRTWGISIGGYFRSGPLWDICQGAVWNVSDFSPNSTRPIKAIFDGIAAYRNEKVRTS